jgi:hypothetical protein
MAVTPRVGEMSLKRQSDCRGLSKNSRARAKERSRAFLRNSRAERGML